MEKRYEGVSFIFLMISYRLLHVNYNIGAVFRMNSPFATGLKLRNSLTSELVSPI